MYVMDALLLHGTSRRGSPLLSEKRFRVRALKTVFSLTGVEVATSRFAGHLPGSAFLLGTFFAGLCLYLGK